jgi:hypothetical protein
LLVKCHNHKYHVPQKHSIAQCLLPARW